MDPNKPEEKMKTSHKMIIMVDADLKMPKGKLAGQVAHAAVSCVIKEILKGRIIRVAQWLQTGQKKVVVKPKTTFDIDIIEIGSKTKESNPSIVTIKDLGKTVFIGPTVTCCAVGLLKNDDISLDSFKLL